MRSPDELDRKLDDETRKVESHDGYHFGDRVQIIEDDEEAGVFAGDTGHLVFETVGAEQYGNVRVGTFFWDDDLIDPVEVDLDNVESIG